MIFVNCCRLFDKRFLLQGQKLYLQGKLHDVHYLGNGLVTACVWGSNADYLVRLTFERDEIKTLECNCPGSLNGEHCEHEAALTCFLEDFDEASLANGELQDPAEAYLKEIAKNLTGDDQLDLAYLNSLAFQAEDTKDGRRVAGLLSRIIPSLLPLKKTGTIDKTVSNFLSANGKIYEQVRLQIARGNFERASHALEELIAHVDRDYPSSSDEVFFNFSGAFEYYLYLIKYAKGQKRIHIIPETIFDFFHNIGLAFREAKKDDLALLAFNNALKWNPLSTGALYECADLYARLGELDESFSLNLKVLEYAFRKEDFVRGYRNLGSYYLGKENDQLAISCYYMSSIYDPKEKVDAALFYLFQKKNRPVRFPSIDEMETLFEKWSIPFGPSDDVIHLAYFLGEKMKKESDLEAANYFYNIFYGLTKDEKVKNIIDSLSNI